MTTVAREPRAPEWADLRWQDQAACRGVDLDVFYPRREADKGSYDRARGYCATCPVRGECLADAMARETETRCEGMWGGMTPDQRRALRRRVQRDAAKAATL